MDMLHFISLWTFFQADYIIITFDIAFCLESTDLSFMEGILKCPISVL